MLCASGTDELRDDLAHFFTTMYPQYIPSTAAFKAVMNAVGSVQLNVTLGKLARGLPVYSVSITGQELTMTNSLIGLIVTTIASALAAMVVIVVCTPSGRKSVDVTEIIQTSRKIACVGVGGVVIVVDVDPLGLQWAHRFIWERVHC
jgi:hypothetical protein